METIEFLKIREDLDLLNRKVTEMWTAAESKFEPKDQSRELNELMTALAKAQSEMEIAGKDSSNPYFKSKYADLASVVSASRPYLTKNGLSVIQQITYDDNGRRILVTILGHSSGGFSVLKNLVSTTESS